MCICDPRPYSIAMEMCELRQDAYEHAYEYGYEDAYAECQRLIGLHGC